MLWPRLVFLLLPLGLGGVGNVPHIFALLRRRPLAVMSLFPQQGMTSHASLPDRVLVGIPGLEVKEASGMIKEPLRSSDGGLKLPLPGGRGNMAAYCNRYTDYTDSRRGTARYWTRGTALARSYFTMARILFSICM